MLIFFLTQPFLGDIKITKLISSGEEPLPMERYVALHPRVFLT
jgi:hypothetical protein